jgi:hypothetical protein
LRGLWRARPPNPERLRRAYRASFHQPELERQ